MHPCSTLPHTHIVLRQLSHRTVPSPTPTPPAQAAKLFPALRLACRAECGGFDFMPRPNEDYYRKLPARIGSVLSAGQYKAVEELGLLVDADDQVRGCVMVSHE